MSYVNAAECLPPELISELQKYVQGGLLYVPRPDAQVRSAATSSRAILAP